MSSLTASLDLEYGQNIARIHGISEVLQLLPAAPAPQLRHLELSSFLLFELAVPSSSLALLRFTRRFVSTRLLASQTWSGLPIEVECSTRGAEVKWERYQ